MAWSLGGRIRQVTLEPDWDDSPRRMGDVQIEWSSGIDWRVETLVCLSGPAAEMVYEQSLVPPYEKMEWNDDWTNAWNFAARKFSAPELRRAKLLEMTKVIYGLFNQDEYWHAIASVADLLLAHGTVYSEELEELLLNLPSPQC